MPGSKFLPELLLDRGEFMPQRTLMLMKRAQAGLIVAFLFSVSTLALVTVRSDLQYGFLIAPLLAFYFIPIRRAYRYTQASREQRQPEKARRGLFTELLITITVWNIVGVSLLPGLDADTRVLAVGMFIIVVYAHVLPFTLFPQQALVLMALNLLPMSIELMFLGSWEVVPFGMCGIALLAMEAGTFSWMYRSDLGFLRNHYATTTVAEPDMSAQGFRRRLVYSIHKNSTPAVLLQATIAFLVVIAMRAPGLELHLWSWLLGYLSLQTLRTVQFVAHQNRPERFQRSIWRTLFGLGVVANQLAWYVLLFIIHEALSGFSLGVISGAFMLIAVVSTIGLTSDRSLLYLNSALCLVPPMVILFAGEEIWSVVSLGTLAALCLLVVVENIHRSSVHSMKGRLLQKLTEFRAHEMNELNAELTVARERLTEVNTSLEAQVEARTQELNHQATHDMLTGLGNRYFFSRSVAAALEEQRSEDHGFAVYLLDLDRFKEINDGLGHLAGDEVLREIAKRLQAHCDEHRICARWGGDEFVMLQRCAETTADVEQFARALVADLRRPIPLEQGNISLGASVGIALCPDHGESADELLEHADIAVYRAKCHRTGVSVYDDRWGLEAAERLQLLQSLRGAVEREEITVSLQPFVSVESGQLTGFEALARWRDPRLDVSVSPGVFIPLAEESGLIQAMGRNLLRKACAALMNAVPDSELRIAVNISVMQLTHPGYVDDVQAILAETGLAPHRLELELTESLFAGNVTQIRRILSELRALGVRISIDDFGTGYSSISYLRDFPLDTLKIDQSFVAGLRSGGDSLFSSIVSLAHGLKLSVIVEGVETRGDLEKVLRLGGEEIQGFYFSRPIEAERLGEWIEHQQGQPFAMRQPVPKSGDDDTRALG